MVAPRRAVFLDRDGVINENVFYVDTAAWEAPRRATDFRLTPGAPAALGNLQHAGYRLVIVSNQPNQAKGKATRADHDAIHAALVNELSAGGVEIAASYYCFHHPDGIIPALSGACPCRKPSPYFLRAAATAWDLDLSACWMIGDRASDVECGRRAGARTIRIGSGADGPAPDYVAVDLATAATIVAGSSHG